MALRNKYKLRQTKNFAQYIYNQDNWARTFFFSENLFTILSRYIWLWRFALSWYLCISEKQAYVKEKESRTAAENREQFRPWTQNFKSFQESFETHGLQRLHTQNTAAGSNVLCWTVFRGNTLLQLRLYSKLFTGSCGKLLLYGSVVWFLYSFTVSPHIILYAISSALLI